MTGAPEITHERLLVVVICRRCGEALASVRELLHDDGDPAGVLLLARVVMAQRRDPGIAAMVARYGRRGPKDGAPAYFDLLGDGAVLHIGNRSYEAPPVPRTIPTWCHRHGVGEVAGAQLRTEASRVAGSPGAPEAVVRV